MLNDFKQTLTASFKEAKLARIKSTIVFDLLCNKYFYTDVADVSVTLLDSRQRASWTLHDAWAAYENHPDFVDTNFH